MDQPTVAAPTPIQPDMVNLQLRSMCGDHPFTKTELNLKESSGEEKEKKIPVPRLTPTSSRTERPAELRARAASDQALRAQQLRRRAHSPDSPPNTENDPLYANRALLQAALGSFRWPPYLVCVWVLVLLVSHALHCLAGLLERSLPSIRTCCHYFRSWAEESWKCDTERHHRVYPVGLACVTGLLYAFYWCLYLVYSALLWSIEPLCADEEPAADVPRLTNYIDEIHSKINVNK